MVLTIPYRSPKLTVFTHEGRKRVWFLLHRGQFHWSHATPASAPPLHRRFQCPRNSRPPCLSYLSLLLVATASGGLGGLVVARAGLGFRLARAPPVRMSVARLFHLVQPEKTSRKGEKTMHSAFSYHPRRDTPCSQLQRLTALTMASLRRRSVAREQTHWRVVIGG